MGRCQKIACGRKGNAGRNTWSAKCIYQLASRYIKRPYYRVEGCSYKPSRVVGKGLALHQLDQSANLRTYKIQHSAFETRELPDQSLCFYVKHPHDQVIADYCQKITISLQCERNHGGGEDERLFEIFGMEIEELGHVLVRMKAYVHLWLTFSVPSNVPATRVLFKASVASPVTHRFFPPFDPLPKWTATSLGAGPSTKDFLFKPDCMFQR